MDIKIFETDEILLAANFSLKDICRASRDDSYTLLQP